MKYKDLQVKFSEVTGESANKVSKEEIIKVLAERGVQIEGDKFAFINEEVKVNEKDEVVTDQVFLSISAKIRFLFDEGDKQSVIAKKCGVRDQFVSNVVRKYKESKKVVEQEDSKE